MVDGMQMPLSISTGDRDTIVQLERGYLDTGHRR